LWVKTAYVDRGILVKEWASGNRITSVQRTDAGTNAGGGNKTDRNPDYVHTLDTLDQEIALATLPMDFDIYDFPASIHRRAKEIIAAKESPWKEWSVALRSVPGILDYSRAAIFAMIRSAGDNVHHFPDSLRRYINSCLTESVHDKPSAETIAAAHHPSKNDSDEEVGRQLAAGRGEYVEGISDPNDPKWVHEDLTKRGSLKLPGLLLACSPLKALWPLLPQKATTKRPPAMCRWKRLSRSKTKLIIRYRQAKALMRMLKNRCRKRTQNFH
jgi:exodeoxyribonuclease VIII